VYIVDRLTNSSTCRQNSGVFEDLCLLRRDALRTSGINSGSITTPPQEELLSSALLVMPTLANCQSGLLEGLTLRLLISYMYGAPSKARNANIYIWTYVWQR